MARRNKFHLPTDHDVIIHKTVRVCSLLALALFKAP